MVPSTMAGRLFGVRLGIGLVGVILTLFLTRSAAAHTLGLSSSEFDVLAAGHVEARFTFATVESLGALVIDRDHDGVVTELEIAAARDDLRAFVVGGVEVDADGVHCPVTFGGPLLTEVDGLVLQASYACPDNAERIEVTLYYLSELARSHREIARIIAGGYGGAMAEAVLSGERRAISLRLPSHSGAPARGQRAGDWRGAFVETSQHRLLVTAVSASSLLLAIVLCWRGAARRKTPGNVDSHPRDPSR